LLTLDNYFLDNCDSGQKYKEKQSTTGN